MEYGTADGSDKDEAMKKTFESRSDDAEKKDKKATKTKKTAKSQPPSGEKSSAEKVEKLLPKKSEDEPKTSLFEIIGIETEAEPKKKEPEKLEPEETKKVAETYVEASSADAAQELGSTEAGTVDEAMAAASVEFLDTLNQKMEGVEVIDETLLQQASNEALENLDIEPLSVEEEAEEPEETESNDDESDVETLEDVDEETDEEDDPLQQATPPPTPTPSPAPPTPNLPPPPPRPTPPTPPTPPPTPPGGQPPVPPIYPQNMNGPNFQGPNNPVNPNTLVTPVANPNALPSGVEFHRRRSRAGDLLLGGVVGYLIGRRRGRINTENKLMPVQRKLETEVRQLNHAIAAQELKVRTLAAKQFENQVEVSFKQKEKIVEIRERIKKPKTEQEIHTKQKSDVLPVIESIAPSTIDTAPIFDKQPPNKFENLDSQTSVVSKNEVAPEKHEKSITKKTAETISLPLLLEMASEIKLGDTSLRTMYERGTVDQKTLRQVMKKYLEGEKLEKIWPEALSEDIEGEELNHEKNHETIKDGALTQANQPSDNADEVATENSYSNEASHEPDRPLSPLSPVLQSIIDGKDQNQPNKSPVPLIAVMTIAVILAVIIISIFT